MQHPFQVAIPSYRRPRLVFEKTIRFCLHTLSVAPSHIHLFLATEDPDVQAYLDAISQNHPGIQVHFGPVGLHHMRNEMSRFFARMAQDQQRPIQVLYLDDDIDRFVQMVIREEEPENRSSRYRLEPIPPREMLGSVEGAFATLMARGLDLFGFYPVANGYFMKDLAEKTYDLRFCVGAAYGMVHAPDVPPYELELEEKEDFERTLLSYQRNGGVLRLNRIAPITMYYKTEGGIQSRNYDRKEQAAQSCIRLIERFPGLCRPYHGKKSGMPEVRLVARHRY